MDPFRIVDPTEELARRASAYPMHRTARTPTLAGAAALGLAVACWSATTRADEIPGAKPGDEALSCEQIYAQGMAESQREQRARDEKAQALKLQEKGLIGAIGAAMATGNPVAGKAANAQALGLAESTNRLADTPNQPNARKERLRQLWTQKRCTAPGSPAGAGKPADDAMTCEQIATKMAPYAQRMAPSVQAAARSQGQLNEQAMALGEKQRAENNALAGMWSATGLDPTGIAKRAAQAATIGLQAKHKAESDALRDSPQYNQTQNNAEQMVAQSQQLQGDARLQQLMRLGQEEGCARK
jgi:hypothetical protein